MKKSAKMPMARGGMKTMKARGGMKTMSVAVCKFEVVMI